MIAHPLKAARSKLWRVNRKLAIPADVKALLERGVREQQELQRQARAVLHLSQIETVAARKLFHIQNVKNPAIRARLLGELADWLIDRRETLTEVAGVSAAAVKRIPINRAKSRRVPAWVPADMAPVYLDPTISEFEAASIVRAMKRDAA